MLESLETTRLALRPFRVSDAEMAFTWFGDPAVMRFTPSGPDASVDETRRRIETYEAHQDAHGFSKWAIRERASGALVGDAGLLVLDGSGKIDLGFRLARLHWNRGLATEAGAKWIEASFCLLGLERLTAFVHPMNAPSVRVLAKLRFRSTGSDRILGMEAQTFALDAQNTLETNLPR